MSDLVVTALIGLVGGAIGALAAPWAQWGVDKRRERIAHRRELVRAWRDGLAAWESAQPTGRFELGVPPTFLGTAWYGSLSGRIDDATRQSIESSTQVTIHPGARNVKAVALQREIDRIESGWKL